MHIHWLQHADHEGLGCIAPWLEANGHSHSGTRLHAGEKPPGVETFDALVVMGGPMNIYEHAAHPWLVEEKALIRAALDAGRRVLGVCLGAQLLAEVLGVPGEANVVGNGETELGFFPVRLTPAGCAHPLCAGLADEITAFHWHGDTYRLPPGAVGLASSSVCAQQAFAFDGSRVLGLQFHLEVTHDDARKWFAEMPAERGPWVQTPAAILADAAAFAANNRAMAQVCANFFGSLS